MVSGILAVISAVVILSLVNNLHLELSNNLLSCLFGDTILSVTYSASVVLLSLFLALILGLVASWFPIVLALRVQPVWAIALES